LIAGVLTDLISWRAAFIIPGIVSIATGLALVACMRAGWVTEGSAAAQTQAAPPPRHAMMRAFVILSITMLCTGLIFHSMAAALPKILAERVATLSGGTAAGAGTLVSIIYFLAMGMQLVGGHLADRHSMRNVYMLVYLLQVPLFLVAAYLSGVPLFAALTGAVLLGTIAIPVENGLLSHYSPEKWRGTAFGAKFVLSIGVSALAVPLVAFLHDYTGGFYWYLLLLGALALLMACAALFLPQDKPARVGAPASAER